MKRYLTYYFVGVFCVIAILLSHSDCIAQVDSASWLLTSTGAGTNTTNLTATAQSFSPVGGLTNTVYDVVVGARADGYNGNICNPNTNDTLSFTFKVNCGHSFTVDSISFFHISSVSGCYQLNYFINNGGANPLSGNITVTNTSGKFLSLNPGISLPQGSILRFKLSGATGNSSSTLAARNFKVYGTATNATLPVVAPASNTPVCSGNTINLVSNPTGGTTPYTFQWSGPSSFSSTLQDPTRNNSTTAMSGTYTVTITDANGCSGSGTTAVTVIALPVVNIIGSTSICVGGTSQLSPNSGGTWVSNSPTVASVNNSGLVTGLASGSATFTFTSSTAPNCANTTAAITVSTLPVVNITGSTSICIGGTSQLSPTSGGTWVSNSPAVASVNNSGLVTGLTVGSSTFTFTSSSSANCTNTTGSISVSALPVVNITGSTSICVGGTSQLSPNSGGTWISNNPTVASITNAGLVTGLAAGSATFTFTSSTAPNCSNTTGPISVSALPVVNITGSTSICVGGTSQLSPNSGGTWISNNPTVAFITNAGLVTGLAAGSATFTFTSSTAPNCSNTTGPISVSALPVVNITGSTSICVGGSSQLSPNSGGTWVSNSPTLASVTNAGLVTGLAAGSATFTFTSSSSASCSSTTGPISVSALPVVGITGNTSICISGTSQLSPSSSGSWVSNSPSIASVSNSGLVTGIAAGNVTFTFTNAAAPNCSNTTATLIVNPTPVGSASAQTICSGLTSNVPLNSTVSNSAFTWTAALQGGGATISGFSNCNSSCGNAIGQSLSNANNSISGTVVYTVTPISPAGCIGSAFTVNVNVNPTPIGSASSQTICSGLPTSAPLNSSVSGSAFTWTAALQGGGATIIGFSNCTSSCGNAITQTLTNNSNIISGTVVYTVTPTSPAGCTGSAFGVNVNVNPNPLGSAVPDSICSGSISNVPLNSTISSTSFTWTTTLLAGPVVNGFSNCSGSCGNSIAQTLTSLSNVNVGNVQYTVIPTSPAGCTGNLFITNVIVNPAAPHFIISDLTSSPDSLVSLNLCGGSLFNSFNISDTAFTYIWTSSTGSPNLVITDTTNNNTTITFNNNSSSAYSTTITAIAYNFAAGKCPNDGYTFTVNVNPGNPIEEAAIIPKEPGHTLVYLDNSVSGYKWGYDSIVTMKPSFIVGQVYQIFVPDNKYIANINGKEQLDTNTYYFWVLLYQINGTDTCRSKVYYNGPYALKKGPPLPDIPSEIITSIIPNPNNGVFDLQVSGNIYGNIKLKIVDILGQSVYKTQIDKTEALEKYPLSLKLKQGLYFVRILGNDNEDYTSKLLIK